MRIERAWAMPSKHTFEIPPIHDLILQYIGTGKWLDPFANRAKFATITNDLDPTCHTDYHLDATDFLGLFEPVSIDGILYDPPYSSRQVAECYKNLGKSVSFETTQGSYWRKHKEIFQKIVKKGGYVISCGWNSGGVGEKYGFEIVHILLVAHGGQHNDTIVTVSKKVCNEMAEIDRKIQENHLLF